MIKLKKKKEMSTKAASQIRKKAIQESYSATILSRDVSGEEAVPITLDGVSTNFYTPHTFTGLSGVHLFRVPLLDSSGNQHSGWDHDGKMAASTANCAVFVTSGGKYTASYYPPYSAWITAVGDVRGTIGVPIDAGDNFAAGFLTPHDFSNITGTHKFKVPEINSWGDQFEVWSTGEKSTTLTVSSGGTYTAYYKAPTYDVTIDSWSPIGSGGRARPIGTDIPVSEWPNADWYRKMDLFERAAAYPFYTPYTFKGLKGVHMFNVPPVDWYYDPFDSWSPGGTPGGGTPTILVFKGGTYVARYSAPEYSVEVRAVNVDGDPVSVPITIDGKPTGHDTPWTFTLVGRHTLTVAEYYSDDWEFGQYKGLMWIRDLDICFYGCLNNNQSPYNKKTLQGLKQVYVAEYFHKDFIDMLKSI